ncbi:glutamate-rich protein 1 isoform X2 [Lemur catta]|uniref:glutamate-rich protein 1 isoform X2 n=1 Tax=Lemur catta TaxID=9447 RepID=UPI001E2695EC|nr:glutamate-rich protein 1 isoform X2 [Lemur catta]
MAARRRHVFVEKVLQRLFPAVPSSQEKRELQSPTAHNLPRDVSHEDVSTEDVSHEDVSCEDLSHEDVRANPVQPLTDGDTEVPSGRRIYTVSLPPEGYVPCAPEPESSPNSENISSSEDSEDQDLHNQPKRRRVRRRKSKRNPSSVCGERSELEKPQSLSQGKSQPPHADGPTVSKNKKRKLKKKQQIRRKKAAGLAAKASSISFTYQPAGSGSDLEAGQADGEVTGAREGGATDASEEDVGITSEKTDSILRFLKSTQEIYFYDGVSKDPDSAVCVETSEELLSQLESRRLPPSDVFILDHMKTLLLLQDTERLRSALDAFPAHCTLPPACSCAVSETHQADPDSCWGRSRIPDIDVTAQALSAGTLTVSS